MSPTNKLRFVMRTEPLTDDIGTTVRVLQQWWEPDIYDEDELLKSGGEWRDIPLEKNHVS